MQLVIDGQEIPDLWRYALRFVKILGAVDENGMSQPVLYKDGKRVTKAWTLIMAFAKNPDQDGGNANTAG